MTHFKLIFYNEWLGRQWLIKETFLQVRSMKDVCKAVPWEGKPEAET